MAQNLTIAGASYSDVPAVNIAKTGGGIATFTDVSDSTVTPETLLEGETAYNAAGELITGTGSLGAVRYDSTQELTDAQKSQARGNIGAAPSSHSHTKSDISDFPSSMAPTAHKASHAINGADAISPTDIGAEASGTAAGLINRTTAVNVANTNYGTVMARGIYAGTTDMTDGVTDLTSGVIYLVYKE